MRWFKPPKGPYRPGFAFWPHRDHDGNNVWLEPIWVRFCGEYTEWALWEENPNLLFALPQPVHQHQGEISVGEAADQLVEVEGPEPESLELFG
jgi:hypothetical protein